MVRQGHLITVVGTFLIGCAVLLLVVGCSGMRSEGPKKGKGHTETTKKDQTRSPQATASEEARCGGTPTIKKKPGGTGHVTNDVSGCPKGGLLRGTDGPDKLYGKDGDDEIRGLGGEDAISGELGSDTLYGGLGNGFLEASDRSARDRFMSEDVLYGGPGRDYVFDHDAADDVLYGGAGDDKQLFAGKGEDVYYGGEGNDLLGDGEDGQRDKLYCGEGKDHYLADKIDYVDSSCEKGKLVGTGGPPLLLLAGAALCSALMMLRYVIRSA